jgi:hypothetical protein
MIINPLSMPQQNLLKGKLPIGKLPVGKFANISLSLQKNNHGNWPIQFWKHRINEQFHESGDRDQQVKKQFIEWNQHDYHVSSSLGKIIVG